MTLPRPLATSCLSFLAAGLAACASQPQALPPPAPTPAPGEWTVLFDGHGVDAWRGYCKPDMPRKGWAVEGDTLHIKPDAGCGDLVTKALFGDFVLELEFKTAPRTNSGVFYRAVEKRGQEIWQSAFECQILDPSFNFDLLHQSGALYGMYPTAREALRPAGQWNQLRIAVTRSGHVEHWLNGIRVVSCDLGGADYQARFRKSKFAKASEFPAFGQAHFGHIGLQDHGDTDTWFRNIRVMSLDQPGLLDNLGM